MSNAGQVKLAIIDPVGAKAGMDYYNNCLVKELEGKGIKCTVFSNYEAESGNPAQYISNFSRSPINGLLAAADYLRAFAKAARHCRKEKVDIVVLHLFSSNFLVLLGYVIVRLRGLRILTIAHDISSFANDDNSFARNLIYNWFSTRISVHNQHSKNVALPFLSARMKSLVFVAGHGNFRNLVLAENSRKMSRQQLGLSDEYKYILFFGQIKKVKGLDVVLRALPEIDQNVKLIIAGKLWKNEFDEYQEIIDTNNLQGRVICHLGFVEDCDRDLFFKSCDLLVLPYREIYQSGVMLMGLSYGMPVIASNLPFFKKSVKDYNLGYCYEVDSVTGLAAAANKALSSDKWLAEARHRCLDYVEKHHNWSDIADRYIDAMGV